MDVVTEEASKNRNKKFKKHSLNIAHLEPVTLMYSYLFELVH